MRTCGYIWDTIFKVLKVFVSVRVQSRKQNHSMYSRHSRFNTELGIYVAVRRVTAKLLEKDRGATNRSQRN